MPILKNAQIGRHRDATLIKFGTGDILISSGHDGDNPSIKVVSFGQDTPKPVEEFYVTVPIEGGDSDGLENIVVMEFTIPESIDVLIKHLNLAKEELIKESNQ